MLPLERITVQWALYDIYDLNGLLVFFWISVDSATVSYNAEIRIKKYHQISYKKSNKLLLLCHEINNYSSHVTWGLFDQEILAC